MVVNKRKGMKRKEKPIKDTEVILIGNYDMKDILYCECKLVYADTEILYGNVTYSPYRKYLNIDTKRKGGAPEKIILTIIKKLGEIVP